MAGIYFFDDFPLDRRVQLEPTYVPPKRLSPEPYQGTKGFVGTPSLHCLDVEQGPAKLV